jgi:hypothetical protein
MATPFRQLPVSLPSTMPPPSSSSWYGAVVVIVMILLLLGTSELSKDSPSLLRAPLAARSVPGRRRVGLGLGPGGASGGAGAARRLDLQVMILSQAANARKRAAVRLASLSTLDAEANSASYYFSLTRPALPGEAALEYRRTRRVHHRPAPADPRVAAAVGAAARVRGARAHLLLGQRRNSPFIASTLERAQHLSWALLRAESGDGCGKACAAAHTNDLAVCFTVRGSARRRRVGEPDGTRGTRVRPSRNSHDEPAKCSATARSRRSIALPACRL